MLALQSGDLVVLKRNANSVSCEHAELDVVVSIMLTWFQAVLAIRSVIHTKLASLPAGPSSDEPAMHSI